MIKRITTQRITAQRIIGLTGGIGMGKSTVSRYLQQTHQLPVLDADELAREAVQPGSAILAAIAGRYGDVLNADGSLNRAALAEIVFQLPEERRWVEQQIHPYVRDRMTQRTRALEGTVVWSVPLLFEANLTPQVTETWVVYCTPQQQQQRLRQRGLSPQQIRARIETQWPIERKLALADVRLDNTSTFEALQKQVDALFSGR